MTFARICRQASCLVQRHRRLLPSSASGSIGSCVDNSAGVSGTSMHKAFTARLFCLSATTTSLVSLLVFSGPRTVDTPLHSSIRHHSDSEAESDSEEAKEKALEEPVIMQKPELSSQLKQAKEEALYGMLVADALAMPVHWYYDPDDIKRGYGQWLTGYVAPNKQHPSSILSLSNTEGSGRGSGSSKPLIGNVILHDKLKFWQGGRSVHYHQGMSPGDNTLNSMMAIQMLQSMNRVDPDLTKPDDEVRASILEDYVKFMTTPGTHNDTYAESFHRAFFKDWVAVEPHPTASEELVQFANKRSQQKLKERPDSQLAVIGSLVPSIPWIIRNAHKSEKDCAKAVADFIRLTHPVASLIPFVDTYARLLHAVLNGHDLKTEVLKVLSNSDLGGPSKRQMVLQLLDEAHKHPKGSEQRLRVYQGATSMLGSACYIEGAMSSMLFLALEFHDDFEGGVLANANCGGENCHRGAALGALLGAAAASRGEKIPAKLRDNLHSMKSAAAQVAKDMNQI